MSIKRRWLNPVSCSDNGWIKYGIDKHQKYIGYDYCLTIADCNRVIDFNFDLDDKKGRKAALKKLVWIEDAVTDMREQLEVLIEKVDE